MAGLLDHMWQSLQVIGCLGIFAWLTRNNSARFRIWLWRIAAVKLVVPLQVLSAIGAWVGFPVTHSVDAPPATLLRLLNDWGPWFSPARHLDAGMRWSFFALLVLATGAAAWWIRSQLRSEAVLVASEWQRLERDPDDHPPGVALLSAALMTAWTFVLLGAPALSGAIEDRLRRQELLHRNSVALREASVIIRPARSGMGSRYRVTVDPRGVTIRNATLREIGGLAYGVSVYLVRGQHFIEHGEDWLSGPRYDVRVEGPVAEPRDFDTYALRKPLTQALSTQYGLEIYDNGRCVPPCGRWGSYVLPAAAREALDRLAASPPEPVANAEPPPLRERFDVYLDAFNSGDRLTLEDFHRDHLTTHAQKAMGVDEELALQKQMGGFDVLEFEEVRPRAAEGWVRARDSDALMALKFEMEPFAPFRIRVRSFTWGSPPKHYFPKRLPEAAALSVIRQRIARQAAAGKFSGAVLISRDGKVLLREAGGLASREDGLPNRIDTRFRIASVTKMFTAVAVLRLVQEGKIDLDDAIGKWVPEVRGKPMAPATIHQLLTHTSGAGDIFNATFRQRHRELRTHSEFVRLFANQELHSPPGSRYRYSNLGYLLLGRMIETISGTSWHEFVKKTVFVPARMERTGTEPEEAAIERSRIYEKPLGMHEYVPAHYVLDYRASAHGHAYSTVDDLARFMDALRSQRLLDEERTRLMLEPHHKVWEGHAYGYGMMFNTYAWTGNWTGHSGGYPGMNAQLWFSPDTGYVVVVLANIDPPSAQNLSDFITARLPVK